MKIPPRELLIQVSNDPSAEVYGQLAPVRWAVEQPLLAAGRRFSDFSRILDFGCGAGRLLQALNLERRADQELWGCDVNEACATWCRENLEFAKVAHTALEPPLPYADASFDLIVAISVFTHLSRPLQVRWARELMRILRPEGAALITTWGLGILPDVLAVGDRWTVREYALLGANGNFLHFAEGPASALEGQREVVALHSADAVARIFSPLRLQYHEHISPIAAGQDASLLVKPKTSCQVILPAGSWNEAGIHCEVPASQRKSVVVSLDFEARGTESLRFRTYLAFAERRFDLVHMTAECRIVETPSGRALASRRFAFPTSVALSADHLIPLTLDVPVSSAIRVELELVLQRAPWQPNPIRFRWWDSRLESGGSASAGGAAAPPPSQESSAEMVPI